MLRFRFNHTAARTPDRDQMLVDWSKGDGIQRVAMAAMYLSLGLPISKLAKTSRGWRFGLCDETGMYTTNPEATHVGWTFDEEEPRAV